jgi:hypothetical protein
MSVFCRLVDGDPDEAQLRLVGGRRFRRLASRLIGRDRAQEAIGLVDRHFALGQQIEHAPRVIAHTSPSRF